jgi:SagB-type dehydrogenase family enzyme
MLLEILEFYRRTKLERVVEDDPSVASPITHTKVFHKEYPRLPRILLPTAASDGECGEWLARRVSSRSFTGESIAWKDLAEILRSCRIADASRDPERRTYPSGGARFPVEVYLIVFCVDGLEPGAYHYAMSAGALEQLWKQDLRAREPEIVSPYVSGTAGALVLTSVMARSEVKYGVKAYPYALIEAGHMGQNFALACARTGVGCCSIGGFVNDSLSEILDLTSDEIPLYVIALGAA